MRSAKILFVVITLVLTVGAFADTGAYISGSGGIYKWDPAGSSVSLLAGSPGGLDSLIFDTNGNIVFSQITTGSIGIYNTTTNATTMLTCCGSGVADMALDPSGASVLVSNAFSTTIWRVNLTSGAIMNSFNLFARPDGLAYDDSGHLFAVRNENSIVQLDPVTGAILKTLIMPAGCGTTDALTFNSSTGKLYASCDTNGGFVTVDTGLTTATYTALSFSPDGIATSGTDLYFVNRGVGGVKYDLNTNTVTQTSAFISGADDIAPLSGPGSAPVPEPASLILLSAGLAGLSLLRKRAR